MELKDYLPIWDKLNPSIQSLILNHIQHKTFKKGELLHDGSKDCAGLMFVEKGQLRAYILSEEASEITTYRLFEYDICLFSASCVLRSIQFDILIEAEKETDCLIIPPHIFKRIMEESVLFSNYINEIMASRFSEVVWLLEQIMWKSLDKRLASFLVEEANIEDSLALKITHEKIANHLGSSREVISRMLKYFQTEGYLKIQRGMIEIIDIDQLNNISEK